MFRRIDMDVEDKGDSGFDPVTAADRAAEVAMRDVLGKHRPHDAILGEELPPAPGSSGLTWILDPIDGTRAFMAGAPSWGTLIAVADEDGPFLGVIDQPYIGERFVGVSGEARLTGPRGTSTLRTRPPRALSEAILFSTFPEIGSLEERRAFEAVSQRVRLTRFGFDCYAYALIAAGQIDLVIEAGLAAYDIAAPIALIEAAGGIVTSWTGGRVDEGGRVIAASCAEVHGEALRHLQAVLPT